MRYDKIITYGMALGLLLLLIINIPSPIAGTLEIEVDTDGTFYTSLESTDDWKAQSFVSTGDMITTVHVALSRTSSTTGTYTISIFDDSGGEPDSSIYTSSSMSISSLPVFPSWSWSAFDHNVDISSGSTYYVVLRISANQDPGDELRLLINNTAPYSGGKYFYSSTGGSSWFSNTAVDIGFRIYSNLNPTADIDWEVPYGLIVNFTAAFSSDPDGTITTWWWDWTNDGSWDDTSSGETPSHTYPASGPYTCKLRVIDDDGAWDDATGSFTLSSGGTNEDPVASFTYSTSSLTVSVDGSGSSDSDGTITGYQWDWTTNGSYDDTGETQSHTYSANGTFNVTLRVMDNGSATNTTMHQVTVTTGGGSSSGFATDNTMTYIIIGVVAAIAIGAVIYFGPTMKKGGRKNK